MSIATASAPGGAADDLQIGEWRLAARRNELSRGTEVVHLEPKAAELLAHLAARPGEVFGREALLAAVWPGVVVGDDALTQAIIKLRKALGDDAHSPRYIETISKRGYRLLAPVGAASSAPSGTATPAPRRRRAWALGTVAVLLLALAGVSFIPGMPWPIGSPRPPAPVAAAIPTIAILPLANLGGDAQREYFADGLTEDLINALGRFSGVRVMSHNAVQAFKGKAPTPQAVGKELGARYVAHGSVRESRGTTRITLQLADVASGALLWSKQYDAAGAELFEVQERIVREIVGSLHVKLTEVELRRSSARPTESLEAYDLVLQARAMLAGSTRESNRRARELASQARKLSPEYSEGPLVLAEAEMQRVLYGWIEEADQGLRRAHQLASSVLSAPDAGAHTRAYVVLSAIATLRDRNDEALENVERALQLNPSDARALARRGSALTWLGRLPEAIEAGEMARRLEPNGQPAVFTPLAVAYYAAGRYAEAVDETNRLLARFPHIAHVHAIRAAALAQLGRDGEAREAAARVRQLDPIFLVEQWGTRFSNPEHRERLQAGLRKAGL